MFKKRCRVALEATDTRRQFVVAPVSQQDLCFCDSQCPRPAFDLLFAFFLNTMGVSHPLLRPESRGAHQLFWSLSSPWISRCTPSSVVCFTDHLEHITSSPGLHLTGARFMQHSGCCGFVGSPRGCFSCATVHYVLLCMCGITFAPPWYCCPALFVSLFDRVALFLLPPSLPCPRPLAPPTSNYDAGGRSLFEVLFEIDHLYLQTSTTHVGVRFLATCASAVRANREYTSKSSGRECAYMAPFEEKGDFPQNFFNQLFPIAPCPLPPSLPPSLPARLSLFDGAGLGGRSSSSSVCTYLRCCQGHPSASCWPTSSAHTADRAPMPFSLVASSSPSPFSPS